jgi:uncharacterized membrane protein
MTPDPRQSNGISLNDPNLAGALAYLFGIITGLAFLALDKRDSVRFHAMQSVIFFLGVLVVFFVLGSIPIVGRITYWPLLAVTAVIWIALMFGTLTGHRIKLPYVGDLAERQLARDTPRS